MKKFITHSVLFMILFLQPFALVSHEVLMINRVRAQTTLGSSAGEYGKCIAMNALIAKAQIEAQKLVQKVTNEIKQEVGNALASSGNPYAQAIGGLLSGGGKVPISSTAIEGSTAGSQTKAEESIRLQRKQECFKKVARKVLTKMTEKTVNWALTGFKGEPFFVKDQGSFLSSIEDEITIKKINELKACTEGGDCPYGRELAKSLITIEKNKTLTDADKFTLDKVNPNWREFTKGESNSFSTGGGWKTFLAYTQNPKNNPLGNFISTSIELNEKKTQETTKIQNELNQNQGFLSLKKCVATSSSSITSGLGTSGIGDVFDSLGNNINGAGNNALNCLKYEVITPGGLIREQLTKALNLPVEQKQAEANQGTDNIEQLANIAIDLIGKGLNKLITSQSSPSIAGSGGPGSNTSFLNTLGDAGTWATGSPEFSFELENPTNPGTPGSDLVQAFAFIEQEKDYLSQRLVLLESFAEKTKTLDECLPGPDINWRGQLNNEYTLETAGVRNLAEGNIGGITYMFKTQAQQAIPRLDALFNEKVGETEASLATVIPSAQIIQSQIRKIATYNNQIIEVKAEIEKREQILSKLNLIKNTIANYPGTITNGEFTENPLQNSVFLQNIFNGELEYIFDDSGVKAAKQALETTQSDNLIAFSTSSASYLNTCISERATISNEIKAKDQGQTLFCDWQTGVAGVNTTSVFGDPIIPRIIGSAYTENFQPLDTGASIFVGIPLQPGQTQIPLKVDCSSYYRTPLDIYKTITSFQ